MSPGASLRYWRPGLAAADPLLLGLAAELVSPGTVIWDIGANVGLFAFAAAFRAGPLGKVVAVEADPWLAGLLRCSTAAPAPGYAPVSVVDAAVADREGIVELVIARRGRAANHLAVVAGSTQSGGTRRTVAVRATTLDAMLRDLPAPELLKIDVEGAELLCLEGGRRLLSTVRPRLLCEVGRDGEAVASLLSAHGYRLTDASLPAETRVPCALPPWNLLAEPR